MLGLWANVPRHEAKRYRTACAAAGRRLSLDEVYDLTLVETGSEEEASRARSDLAAELLRHDQDPV